MLFPKSSACENYTRDGIKCGYNMNVKQTKSLVDIGLILSFLICFITGIIKIPVLLKYLDLRFLDVPVFQITQIHDWSGIILGILVVIHLTLNWRVLVSLTAGLLKND